MFCPVDIPQAYPSELISASTMMIIGFMVSKMANIPMSISDHPESPSPITPIVFIQIFVAILLAVSCRTIHGTHMRAKSI